MDTYKKPSPSTKAAARPAAPQPAAAQPRSRKVWFIAAAVLVLIIAAGIGYKLYAKQSASLAGVNEAQYQALFLTNGQVYFGKLAQADSSTIKLTDIFYLQVQQPVQPSDGEADTQGETQLVKLGEELHGPEDEMFVDRGQVLFWENLKDSGRVVEAIKEFKKQ